MAFLLLFVRFTSNRGLSRVLPSIALSASLFVFKGTLVVS
jgi:hypothetical protein